MVAPSGVTTKSRISAVSDATVDGAPPWSGALTMALAALSSQNKVSPLDASTVGPIWFVAMVVTLPSGLGGVMLFTVPRRSSLQTSVLPTINRWMEPHPAPPGTTVVAWAVQRPALHTEEPVQVT